MSSKPTGTREFLANALAVAVSQQKRKPKTSAGVLALDAPQPPDWWDGDERFAGLVPREEQEKDMNIQILNPWPEGAESGEFDLLQFQWKPTATSDWQDAQAPIRVPGPIDSSTFPKDLTLSSANFAKDGTFDLRYGVTIWNGVLSYSEISMFIIDKVPPNDNQAPNALTFSDQTIVSDGITAEYLAANGGVEVVIPTYSDKQLGDSLELYVHNENTVPTIPAYSVELDTSQQIKVPASAFGGLQDGTIYLYYRLLDKAGNRGPTSNNAETGLFIKPLPVVPMAAPLVPRIDDDKVLNLEDVALGEDLVEIKLYPNWLEGDRLELTWGTSPVKVYHEMTSNQDPIVLIVPYSTILAPAYGPGPGLVPTAISYDVKRGNRTFGSDVTTIDVDFFVPGPVNPERPKPINPNLPQVTVRGTGPSPTDNVLNLDDADLPVEVTVDLYDPIGAGEQMILYWHSLDHQVGTYTPDPVSDQPGDLYTFTVPWDDIKDLPSSAEVPVFYTVGRVDGTGNVESCVPTLVDVTEALPIFLAELEFPDAGEALDGTPILNCTSFIGPDQHVLVSVPGNSPLLKGGEVLTFSWQCYTNSLGTVPAGPPLETTKTLTAEEATDGFELIFTPFTDYILPVGSRGSVRLTYTSDTTPVMQGEVFIRASAVNAGGTCPPNAARRSAVGGCSC